MAVLSSSTAWEEIFIQFKKLKFRLANVEWLVIALARLEIPRSLNPGFCEKLRVREAKALNLTNFEAITMRVSFEIFCPLSHPKFK